MIADHGCFAYDYAVIKQATQDDDSSTEKEEKKNGKRSPEEIYYYSITEYNFGDPSTITGSSLQQKPYFDITTIPNTPPPDFTHSL